MNALRVFRVAAPSIRIVPWAALASCWPLPQQRLPVSATGGGRRRCCASSAEELFIISRLSRSAERSKRIFTGGVVAANGICSAACCASAALRGKVFAEFQRAEPSQSSLRDASSPEGGALSALTGRCVKALPSGELARERLRGCPLPLGGAVAQRLRGSKSAEPEKTVKRSSRRTGVNLQFFPVGAHFFRIVKGEQPLARCGVGGVQR